jgi:hypothetical protein
MEDIPAAFPAVGDDAFRRFQEVHRSQVDARFDAWVRRAPAAFSRSTVHGGRSAGRDLRDEQPTAEEAEEDETARGVS